MFCPRCATQNDLTQNYCRQCGQLLSGARLDLEGGQARSLEELQKSERLIRVGTATLIVFNLITLVVAITTVITTGLAPSMLSIILDLMLGLTIGVPMILVGRAKRRRAGLLSAGEIGHGRSLTDQTRQLDPLTTTGLSAELNQLPSQGSVTEQTTLNLKRTK
jgi:hypothetical protein